MLLIRGRLGFAVQQKIKAINNSQQKACSSNGLGVFALDLTFNSGYANTVATKWWNFNHCKEEKARVERDMLDIF